MDIIVDIFKSIFRILGKCVEWLLNWFLRLNHLEKALILTSVGAFFAIVLPVGRYYIFETWFFVNNPLAVYMIAIVLIVFGSLYIPPLFALLTRSLVNLYYLGWVIYLHLAGELTKAPYELTNGYYVNLAIPSVYIVLSILEFLIYGRE